MRVRLTGANIVAIEFVIKQKWRRAFDGTNNSLVVGALIWSGFVCYNGEYQYYPHCMQRFRASVSIAAGANPLKLSRELGHSSVQITYDTYGHLMKEDADKFAENASHVQRLLTG